MIQPTPSREPLPRAAPCGRCGNAFAGYLEKCPACGAPGGGPSAQPPPAGWKSEREGEALRLRATWTGRLFGSFMLGQVVVLVLATLIVLPILFAGGSRDVGRYRRPGIPLVVVLGAWGSGAAAWVVFGRREMVAAKDVLRLETHLGPLASRREFRCAVLRVEEFRGYRSRGWRLVVEGLGGREVVLHGGLLGKAPLEQMGRLLARETGWEFRAGSDWGGWL